MNDTVLHSDLDNPEKVTADAKPSGISEAGPKDQLLPPFCSEDKTHKRRTTLPSREAMASCMFKLGKINFENSGRQLSQDGPTDISSSTFAFDMNAFGSMRLSL